MPYVRTQIYLEPRQHGHLKEEAHRRGLSLAELLRRLVDEGLSEERLAGDLTPLMGLGASAGGDVSSQKDEWLARAVEADLNR